MKLKLLLLTTCITIFSFAQQIPEELRPPSWDITKKQNLKPYQLPKFDIKSLQEEDAINDLDKSKPWRFGYELYVDHDFNNYGQWMTLENGDKIWRMAYTSKNAYSLNFVFDEFYLPEGAKLYVYNHTKDDLIRPFSHHNNNPEEVLGTWLVTGDHAVIELYEPAHVAGQSRIRVGSVVHGYRTAAGYEKALNDSGPCNHDVDCDITPPSDPYNLDTLKENVKKSVGLISTGTGLCTGTLVNNTNNDGTPYFLTANHCGGGEPIWSFRFNWRSPNPSCGTFVNSTNGSFNTVSGSSFRASSSQSDMKLVQITDNSFFNNNPDVVWAGWNRSTTQVPIVNFGIHHPSGDIQKVCREDDGAYRQPVDFFGNPDTQMWFIDDWELGVTEQGSSGSGLFNENGELIGMLSGGSAACVGTSASGFDFYGRFGVAWDFGSTPASRLREWLDPAGTNATTVGIFPPLQTFDNDAAVSDTSNSSSLLCNEDFSPLVTVVNNGDLNLTEATISYALDGETPNVVNWTGNLSPGETEVVATPTYSGLSSGSYSFSITVNNPNGVADQNTTNNSYEFNFNVSPEFETTSIILDITTDDFPNETSWELANANGFVIDSGPDAQYPAATSLQETIALPILDACYTFTLFDAEDDGLCCGYGFGSFNLLDENDNAILVSDGQFTSSVSVTFNAKDALSISDNSLESLVRFYPNPVGNTLHVDLGNVADDVTYEMHNTLGQVIKKGTLHNNTLNTLETSTLNSGFYFVTLSTDSKSSFTYKFVKK